MNRQQNYDMLIAERNRLESRAIFYKGLLRKDLQQLNHQLQPSVHLLNLLGGVFKTASRSSLLSTGIKLGASVLLGGNLLRKSNPVVKFGLPIAWQYIRSRLFSKKVAKA